MKEIYDTTTKDKVIVSYSILFELGLSPSNKGTIYLKELIDFIILNNLYDFSYKKNLELFSNENNYNFENIKSNIKNSLYRINYLKAQKNFEKYLNLPFDPYYLSPSKFISIISLKYKS